MLVRVRSGDDWSGWAIFEVAVMYWLERSDPESGPYL